MFRRSVPRSAIDEDFTQVVAERSAASLRTAWLSAGAVLTVVVGVALGGALLSTPAPDGRPVDAAAHPNGPTVSSAAYPGGRAVTLHPSGQPSVSIFANPKVSQAYVTISPGPDRTEPNDLPERDAPLPLEGTCPESVDLMRIPVHNPWDATTWPRQVRAVTLCRYAQSTFDTSTGHNILTQGPVEGDLAVFAAALAKALPPVRPINHMGCRIANPDPPYPIDIVFVTASGGTGKAYVMERTLCDPPWSKDPQRTLEEAVDAVLGTPY